MVARQQKCKTKNNTTNDYFSLLGSKVNNRRQFKKTYLVSNSQTKYFYPFQEPILYKKFSLKKDKISLKIVDSVLPQFRLN